MLERVFVLLVLGLAFAAVARAWSAARTRRVARERFEEGLFAALEALERRDGDATSEEATPPPVRPFLRRYYLAPWLAGVALVGIVNLVFGLRIYYGVMFGVILGMVLQQVEGMLAARKTIMIETQLADAIDLMVAALQSGSGVLNCLEAAAAETRAPLRPQLDELLGRIRFGDDPQAVYRNLTVRVPLETFRLFASALAVHSEVGGSLAPTLATVGRIIRDRIELSRRIRSLTVQSRASTYAILGTTYFIALVMWRTDPHRMEEFLATAIGSAACSAAVVLQAVGIMWSSLISKLKY